jgi:hypothetical protein
MALFQLFVFSLLGYEPGLFLFLECQKNVGSINDFQSKALPNSRKFSNVHDWLRDLNALSATLKAVFSAIIAFLI